MDAKQSFDYYYGDESNLFSFYRIPRVLITGNQFHTLSTDAKLLYGLLLDRMGLSLKNGWHDEQGRVFIYYTLDEIQTDLNCGHDKATKLLVELDCGKQGFGLIERVRQGQGKPTKIYVKQFTSHEIPPQPASPQISRLPLLGSQDCGIAEVQTTGKSHSRMRKIRSPDCGTFAGSYTKSNQTDFIYTDPSIYPSPSVPPGPLGWMDRSECRAEINERIEYQALCRQFGREDVECVAELMADVLCSTRPTTRVSGEDLPTVQVQDRFLMLDYGHLEYVFDCLRHNTTEIRNIRAYLLTALYNAPVTMSVSYRAQVQHDFGP